MPDPRKRRGLRYPLAGLLTVAIDGKTLRGARRADGGQVHLLSALDTSTGIVLAQVTISAKSNEIPAFHHVRDVTFHEDLHQARTSNGPAVMAALRNTEIGFHRLSGETNIARAIRCANRRPHDLITAVTSTDPRAQDPATVDVGGPLLAGSW
ncbi:hypothetical protein [Plantactinospora sp. KLBMP9567]|uniref:hypothetical protein n=1 Tax=Plantactinospora sp. KLBMP9567 TaxID=3085900 RepID=UPI00399090DF